jgi:GntR family transcriptional regulator/MocR family aminotransferase
MQIYLFYKKALLSGQIGSPYKLPSIRQLAQHLNISRNPIEAAYAQLIAEGYIEGKLKSGYYALELELVQPFYTDEPDKTSRLENQETASSQDNQSLIQFSYDHTAIEYFPLAKWKTCTMKTLQLHSYNLLDYGDRKGEIQLRVLIAEYVRQNRGVICDPEQVIVTAGTQQAASLLGLLLRQEHSTIGVEQAMHPGVLQVLNHHLNPIPFSIELDGIHVDELYQHPTVRAVYVTPSHQFPYGMTMSAGKRLKLLQWAKQANGVVIEDDYDSDFLYEGRPVPALQGLDPNGCVVYLGTFSKALAPALRLSYMILPISLMTRFERELPYYDQPVSRLTQKTMELFMEQGNLDKHVRKMRKVYRHKREVLLNAIASCMGDHVELSGTTSGLHIIVQVRSDRTSEELVNLAAQGGVQVHSIMDYTVGNLSAHKQSFHRGRAQLLLGFGGLSIDQITEGVSRLAQAWRL